VREEGGGREEGKRRTSTRLERIKAERVADEHFELVMGAGHEQKKKLLGDLVNKREKRTLYKYSSNTATLGIPNKFFFGGI
jgi:hypothetical protein